MDRNLVYPFASPEVIKSLRDYETRHSWLCLDDDGHPHKTVWAHQMAEAARDHDDQKDCAADKLSARVTELSGKQAKDDTESDMPLATLDADACGIRTERLRQAYADATAEALRLANALKDSNENYYALSDEIATLAHEIVLYECGNAPHQTAETIARKTERLEQARQAHASIQRANKPLYLARLAADDAMADYVAHLGDCRLA